MYQACLPMRLVKVPRPEARGSALRPRAMLPHEIPGPAAASLSWGDLRREGAQFVLWVLNCCSLEGALEGAHCILLLRGDYDDAAASWHLEDIVAMVHGRLELGKCWVP